MIYELGGSRPQLPPEGRYWVAPSATVLGDVVLEADVSVWFGAVLRGDCERLHVGEGSNIQDGSVLHADHGIPLRIGRNVTVGHQCMLHGCTVGDGALIGIGAVVLNGAVIGEGSLVGAKSLVPEGKEFPPGSLILGAPARVVRALTPEQQAMIAHGAAHYRENWKRFARELKPLG
jgi:carbonic anhydrase/acetyltransferase-like protein (isoleucine patch superfamily)